MYLPVSLILSHEALCKYLYMYLLFYLMRLFVHISTCIYLLSYLMRLFVNISTCKSQIYLTRLFVHTSTSISYLISWGSLYTYLPLYLLSYLMRRVYKCSCNLGTMNRERCAKNNCRPIICISWAYMCLCDFATIFPLCQIRALVEVYNFSTPFTS